MRHSNDARDGTMHALIAAAIEAARGEDLPRLALAAVPRQRTGTRGLADLALSRIEAAAGLDGIARFKAAFAPRYETLYLAAPSRLALVVGALEIARRIARRIARPGALPAAARVEKWY